MNKKEVLLVPLVLVILDGFGMSPVTEGNAIFATPTPNFDQLLSYFPHTLLSASGQEVGLQWGEMGNSEVGHLNLGTGRVIMQDLPRIDKSIEDGSFFANLALKEAFDFAQKNNSNIHLIGLASSGGVHSHLRHLYALLDMAGKMKLKGIFLHLMTDGRDTPPKAIEQDLAAIESKLQSVGGKVASVGGRYLGMDRDKHWDRVEKMYLAMFSEGSIEKPSAQAAIKDAYQTGQTDEFIEPVRIADTPRIKDKDSVIFFNFRSDRAKQLSESIINPKFEGFNRPVVLTDYRFVTFTSYGHEPTPQVKIAFFAEALQNQLASVLSNSKLTQLHLAETEKYPHVTYFFNGGVENPYPGESRILVPSPRVATYDLKPEMSAEGVASKFVEFFNQNHPLFSIINIANPDMVGHTGIFESVKLAIAATDIVLGKISFATLNAGANLVVTADHGNAEQMINPQTQDIDKEHTTNPVPLILAFQEKRIVQPMQIDLNYKISLAATPPTGVLADVSPTALDVLGLAKPSEMSGQSLRQVI